MSRTYYGFYLGIFPRGIRLRDGAEALIYERMDDSRAEQTIEKNASRAHYCVLYTQALKQWKVSEFLQRTLPEGKGEVFYPCREIWWHGLEKSIFRPLFPGYVFIRSELERTKLHELIRQSRVHILSFVKELHISEERIAGVDVFEDGSDLIDLSAEEAEFFDLLFGFRFDAELDVRRERAAEAGQVYQPGRIYDPSGQVVQDAEAYAELTEREKAAAAELRRRQRRVPEKGVVQMSFGYREGGKYVIMDGPLRGHEDRIRDYNAKDWKAYLNIKIGGKVTKVGMVILGKRIWYPKDKEAPDILPDGTVCDCRELTRIMNGGAPRREAIRTR